MARTIPDPHLARVLYGAFVNGPYQLAPSARRMGVDPAVLYSLCEGHRHVLATIPPRVYLATRDLPLYSELVGADLCGLTISARPQPAESITTDGRSAACKLAAKVGELAALVDAAVADGVVTQAEHETCERAMDATGRILETMRALLHSSGPIRGGSGSGR